jgi:Flp pilus assembly pilin Flp
MNGLKYRAQLILLLIGFEPARAFSIRREEGQTFVEYAMILALVVITMTAALTFMRNQIDSFYSQISVDFNTALS